jgi:predicted nucleotidyltransferase
MILTIEEIKEKIRPVCERYKIKRLFLFGSYARGEATEESDVDVHVQTSKDMGLIELSGFRLCLEEALGKEVDVITCIPHEYKIFKKYVEREEQLLYENNGKRRTNIAGNTKIYG